MKKRITYLLLIAGFLITGTLSAQEKTTIQKTRSSATIGGVKYYLHTVEKGQTLFAIAKFYNREINEIVIENPEAIDGIRPGQVLRIPMQKKVAAPKSLTRQDSIFYLLHKVEKGQTIYGIRKLYNISDERLLAANPELADGLKIGQVLRIPPETGIMAERFNERFNDTVSFSATEVAKDSSVSGGLYPGEKHEEYNVGFILPFDATEIEKIDREKLLKGEIGLPGRTSIALQFYEGVLIALDSVKRAGVSAKIFVYDVDDRDSGSIERLLKKPELQSMHLLVGPLYGSAFMPVARFAKDHNIPIVSPFTQINKILFDNPYVCKLSPSSTYQVEQMATFVVDSFSAANIIVINNLDKRESAFVNAFRSTANTSLAVAKPGGKDTVRIATSITSAQSFLSSDKKNIVVIPSNNQSFVSDFISKLNFAAEKKDIVLVGMPSWLNYENLDYEYLERFSLHVPSNCFIDYSDVMVQNFIAEFRTRYDTEPDTYAFQGYDLTVFFLNSLQQSGAGFLNHLEENKYRGVQCDYEFSRVPGNSGFENNAVHILRFDDYKIVKVR